VSSSSTAFIDSFDRKCSTKRLHKGKIGMSSKLVNIEFSERIKRAFQLLPAYAYLTGAQISKVQSFAETLLGLSNVSREDSPRFSGMQRQVLQKLLYMRTLMLVQMKMSG
jgi:hypothetical protein